MLAVQEFFTDQVGVARAVRDIGITNHASLKRNAAKPILGPTGKLAPLRRTCRKNGGGDNTSQRICGIRGRIIANSRVDCVIAAAPRWWSPWLHKADGWSSEYKVRCHDGSDSSTATAAFSPWFCSLTAWSTHYPPHPHRAAPFLRCREAHYRPTRPADFCPSHGPDRQPKTAPSHPLDNA